MYVEITTQCTIIPHKTTTTAGLPQQKSNKNNKKRKLLCHRIVKLTHSLWYMFLVYFEKISLLRKKSLTSNSYLATFYTVGKTKNLVKTTKKVNITLKINKLLILDLSCTAIKG